jgi:UPF0755 protein
MKLYFKVLLVAFLSVVLVFIWLLNAKIERAQIYQVKAGFGFSKVSQDLQSPALWILSKLKRTKLKSGFYQIQPNMRVLDLLTDFAQFNVKKTNITLIEGNTIEAYFEYLNTHNALKNQLTLAQVMSNIGVKSPYEGQFYPETYQVNFGDSVSSVLKRAHQKQQKVLQNIWRNRDKNLPLSNPQALLVLASIIEKESANIAEKPNIASVFVNRLNKNMRLQTDPSVIYALGTHYTGKLSKQDLRFNSVFNTYRHKGLPPSAIASVSLSSLYAAAHPNKTEYLYFVAKSPTTHIFAKTYKQHLHNVNLFLKKR